VIYKVANVKSWFQISFPSFQWNVPRHCQEFVKKTLRVDFITKYPYENSLAFLFVYLNTMRTNTFII